MNRPSPSRVGIDVLVTTQNPLGKALLIDTRKFGQVAIRSPLGIRIGWANDDNTRNLLRYVAEERLVLTVNAARRRAGGEEPADADHDRDGSGQEVSGLLVGISRGRSALVTPWPSVTVRRCVKTRYDLHRPDTRTHVRTRFR